MPAPSLPVSTHFAPLNPVRTLDFFDRQDQARRRTFHLLALYAIAVAAVILLLFLATATVMEGVRLLLPRPEVPRLPAWRDWSLLGWMATYVLLIIGGSVLCRWIELRAGGSAVAALFSGRRIDPFSAAGDERRLVNVVEEMAVASGVPVPEIYVLDGQRGINALAAGFSVHDAAVVLTRGALQHLDRDELQGVVAHEFSHILYGDMRLNVRMISLFNGLLVIHTAGRTMLHLILDRESLSIGITLARGASSFFLGIAFLLIGGALTAIGFIGAVAARLIQAAVSRQREFLADAAAVQFTRNPAGLAGALRKIGGHARHGVVRHAHAEEASHMFIAEAVQHTSHLFDSHPPLATRIQKLDPSFDGTFPEIEPVKTPSGKARTKRPKPAAPSPGRAHEIVALQCSLALLENEQLNRAQRILEQIPASLRSAARETVGAQAIAIYLLHWNRDATCPFDEAERCDPAVAAEMDRLLSDLCALPEETVLSLAELLLPALRLLSIDQYRLFRRQLDDFVSGGDLSLSGFCLRQVLTHHLDRHFQIKSKRPRKTVHSLAEIERSLFVVLSALAHAGEKNTDQALRAARMGLPPGLHHHPLLPRNECRSQPLAEALATLASASLKLRRTVLEAALLSVASDRKLAHTEADLLQALAAALDLPAPALLGLETPPADQEPSPANASYKGE
jgi:Zn-dependent protease with chaperone function